MSVREVERNNLDLQAGYLMDNADVSNVTKIDNDAIPKIILFLISSIGTLFLK